MSKQIFIGFLILCNPSHAFTMHHEDEMDIGDYDFTELEMAGQGDNHEEIWETYTQETESRCARACGNRLLLAAGCTVFIPLVVTAAVISLLCSKHSLWSDCA